MARKVARMKSRYRYVWLCGVFSLVCGCFPGMNVHLAGDTSASAGAKADSGSKGGSVRLHVNPKTGEIIIDAGGGAAEQSADADSKAAAAISAQTKKMDTFAIAGIVIAGVAGIIYLLHTFGPTLLDLLKK